MLHVKKVSETQRIDLLNSGLIFISFVLALIIPFPLFLFAYAVLGPLHYLTEISWLHDRSYFIPGAQSQKLLIFASVIVSAGIFLGQFPATLVPVLVYLLFGGAFILATVVGQSSRRISITFLLLSAIAFSVTQPPLYVLFFTIFVQTVVHVFFFTGAFMLSGALRSRSIIGYANCVLLVLAAAILFYYVPDWTANPSRYVLDNYPFASVNMAILDLLSPGASHASLESVFASSLGQAVMQFLAFAYTYHYLNWFSKSRIIGWGQVSPTRRNAVIVGWIAAVAAYAYDYRVGVQLLLFLSFLHVFLEFPLNHRSFTDIGQRIVSLFPRRQIEV